MKNGSCKRGFVTIATGDEKYYHLALNLLRSFRLHNTDDTPFGLICDREWELTTEFDHVVIMDNPTCSYLDKLQLGRYSPYEETIFVDADALFLRDPSVLWSDYAPMGDFSCYGKPLPLDAENGWFAPDRLGEFADEVSFGVQMHGGLYYFRRTGRCAALFDRAIHLAHNFSDYSFRYFTKPADEPVLALSMAVAQCKPCEVEGQILFVPTVEKQLCVSCKGQVLLHKQPSQAVIIHFTNGYTRRFLYHFLLDCTLRALQTGEPFGTGSRYLPLRLRYLPIECSFLAARLLRKCISPQLWKKIRRLVK